MIDELFDTSKMFTLSGDQKAVIKTWETPEKKGRLPLEVKTVTVDELFERLGRRGHKKGRLRI